MDKSVHAGTFNLLINKIKGIIKMFMSWNQEIWFTSLLRAKYVTKKENMLHERKQFERFTRFTEIYDTLRYVTNSYSDKDNWMI